MTRPSRSNRDSEDDDHRHHEDVRQCANVLLYTCKVLFPKYPPSYFPLDTFVVFMKKYQDRQRRLQGRRVRLRPMPSELADLLVQAQSTDSILSDHTVFMGERIYKRFAQKLNWVQLSLVTGGGGGGGADSHDASPERNGIGGANRSSFHEDLVRGASGRRNPKFFVPVIVVKHCQESSIFCKETVYDQMFAKYGTGPQSKCPPSLECDIFGFDEIQHEEPLPDVVSSASIAVHTQPYDLPNDLLDQILRNYFQQPRFVYSNWTYAIRLDEQLVGSHFYSRYHHLFAHLHWLHIRCAKLEALSSSAQGCGVILKCLTTLQQVQQPQQIKFSHLPRRQLHSLAFARLVPEGLRECFDRLYTDCQPFLTGTGNQKKIFARNKIFPVFMVHGQRGSGKALLVEALAAHLGYHLYRVDCNDLMGQVAAHTETKMSVIFSKYKCCQPMILWLDNFEVYGIDNDGNEDSRLLITFQNEVAELFAPTKRNADNADPAQPVQVLVIVTSNATDVKPFLKRQFLDTIEMRLPSQAERLAHLRWLFTVDRSRQDFYNGQHRYVFDTVQVYSTRTGAMHRDTYKALCLAAEESQGYGLQDLRLLYAKADQGRRLRDPETVLCAQDFAEHLQTMEKAFGESFGAPKVPKVLWSDIGGLWKLKDEIQNSIGLPLKHVKLMGKSLRRSGILLYGPPGTGKTLVAKAVATECNLNFLAVQGPELLNMYVGQSEQNVREIFARARAAAPCVIFLDELDSLAPNRGVAGDSGGVMDRVVSQLLAEMDGLSTNKENLFILAATNRPDLIDPALLRPGRFDKLLYIGPCVTAEDKMSVLSAQTKKFQLDAGLQLEDVVDLLHLDLTGADMYSVCSNAWLVAVRRLVAESKKEGTQVDTSSLKSDDVLVKVADFEAALEKFVPSISAKDMEYFHKLRTSFS